MIREFRRFLGLPDHNIGAGSQGYHVTGTDVAQGNDWTVFKIMSTDNRLQDQEPVEEADFEIVGDGAGETRRLSSCPSQTTP